MRMNRFPARLLAASVAVLIVLGVFAVSVDAHGGGTPRLSDVEAGPYRLFVWTQPEPWRVGEAHVTVAVTLPTEDAAAAASGEELAQPVVDATVNIEFASPADVGVLQVEASAPTSAGSPTYEADTELAAAGAWQVTVSVMGQDGSGSASFVVDVLPARVVNWPLLIGGAAALVAIVGGMGMWSRRGHASQRTSTTRRRAA